MHLYHLALLLSVGSLSVADVSFGGTTLMGTNGIKCPGVQHVDGDDSYCCVGGKLTLSNCPGWPICSGPTSFDPKSTTLSCATKIPLTASDYSKLVSSASDSFYNGHGGPARTEATATNSEDGPTSTGDAQTSGGSDNAVTTTSPNAAVRTGANLLAGGVLAVAVLL